MDLAIITQWLLTQLTIHQGVSYSYIMTYDETIAMHKDALQQARAAVAVAKDAAEQRRVAAKARLDGATAIVI